MEYRKIKTEMIKIHEENPFSYKKYKFTNKDVLTFVNFVLPCKELKEVMEVYISTGDVKYRNAITPFLFLVSRGLYMEKSKEDILKRVKKNLPLIKNKKTIGDG